MNKVIARLRSRSTGDLFGKVSSCLDKTRFAWRLPAIIRRLLREGDTSYVSTSPSGTSTKSILIISHDLGASGAPKLLAEVVRACIASGWQTVVLAPKRGFYERLAGEGSTIIIHPDALNMYSPAISLAQNADLIICNTIACDTLIDYLPAEKLVWFLHETGAIDTVRRVRPVSLKRVSEVKDVWASSELVANKVAIERPNCFVIGAAVERVTPITAKEDYIKVVVLAGFETRKGQDIAIGAFTSLPLSLRKSTRIEFYGKIVEEEFGQREQKRIAQLEQLTYSGEVSPDEAVRAIAASDIVLIPSRDEPLSLVAIEAMSAGKIIVCSTAAGVASSLTDGVNGFVAGEASVQAIAAALVRAVDAREDWSAIGVEARRVYNSRFTPAIFRSSVIRRSSALLGLVSGGFDDEGGDEWSDTDLYFSYTGC